MRSQDNFGGNNFGEGELILSDSFKDFMDLLLEEAVKEDLARMSARGVLECAEKEKH